MREFKVLPTSPDFRALTEHQIEFIAYSMQEDRREADRMRRQVHADTHFQDYDDSWWTADLEDFTAKREDHDEALIAQQVASLSTEEDMKKLRARWDASLEADDIVANGGTTVEQDSINAVLQANLNKVLEEARGLEAEGINKWGEMERSEADHGEKLGYDLITKESIDEAIAIFNGDTFEDDDEDLAPITSLPTRDDEMYI